MQPLLIGVALHAQRSAARPARWLPLPIIALLAAIAGWSSPVSAEWVPVRDVSLIVQKGSPLDFSGFWPLQPAGASGRVVADANGALVFEHHPETRARFHCAALAWSPASGSFPDKVDADRYAEQLRIHGYNIARFHYFDAILMSGRDKDFDYDPVQLDRFR